jgi:hypothetical protein
MWLLFQDVCRPILTDIERTAAAGDFNGIEPLLQELLDVPKHTLIKKRGGRRRFRASIANQLRTAITARNRPTTATQTSATPIPVLPPATSVNQSAPQSSQRPQAEQPLILPAPENRDQVPAAAVKRAVALTLTNHASRAVRTLYQDTLPEINAQVEAEIIRLHPPLPPSSAIPSLPGDAPFVPVLGDDRFIRIWRRKIATGAAPAASGFTGDHGLPLLEDDHCLRGLAALVQMIRNGQLNDRCRGLLLGCPVIATRKTNGGIRPVTMGETLYKMAAALALDDVLPFARELLGDEQFALLAGGVEVATLALKAALETQTAVHTDMANAFNSLDRAVMMRELYSHRELAPIWRLANFCYSQPVNLHLYDNDRNFLRFIESLCGPLQGEPFSQLLYCLTTKPLTDESKIAGGPDVKVIAITDDVVFVGPPDGTAAMRAVMLTRQRLRDIICAFKERSPPSLIFMEEVCRQKPSRWQDT